MPKRVFLEYSHRALKYKMKKERDVLPFCKLYPKAIHWSYHHPSTYDHQDRDVGKRKSNATINRSQAW